MIRCKKNTGTLVPSSEDRRNVLPVEVHPVFPSRLSIPSAFFAKSWLERGPRSSTCSPSPKNKFGNSHRFLRDLSDGMERRDGAVTQNYSALRNSVRVSAPQWYSSTGTCTCRCTCTYISRAAM